MERNSIEFVSPVTPTTTVQFSVVFKHTFIRLTTRGSWNDRAELDEERFRM